MERPLSSGRPLSRNDDCSRAKGRIPPFVRLWAAAFPDPEGGRFDMAAEPLCCKADLGKRASARASSRRLAVPDLKALMRVGMVPIICTWNGRRND
jgi:hypothetical protein